VVELGIELYLQQAIKSAKHCNLLPSLQHKQGFGNQYCFLRWSLFDIVPEKGVSRYLHLVVIQDGKVFKNMPTQVSYGIVSIAVTCN
jgi:hypothetical protein